MGLAGRPDNGNGSEHEPPDWHLRRHQPISYSRKGMQVHAAREKRLCCNARVMAQLLVSMSPCLRGGCWGLLALFQSSLLVGQRGAGLPQVDYRNSSGVTNSPLPHAVKEEAAVGSAHLHAAPTGGSARGAQTSSGSNARGREVLRVRALWQLPSVLHASRVGVGGGGS